MKTGSGVLTRLFTGISIACVCYAVSCTKPANVSFDYEPKLVLHGYIPVGDTFKVALGKTLKSAGNQVPGDDTYIENGWVVLYEGSVFLDSLKYNAFEKLYVSRNRIAETGKAYTIRAGAPGYPSIEAISIAPSPVNLTGLQRAKNARKNSGGIWLDDLTFTFNDPAGERNFFLAALQSFGTGIACVYSYDPAVERHTVEFVPFEQIFCIDSDQILYNDKTFDGTLKSLTISVHAAALDTFQDPSTGKIYRPYLTRYSITEDYYRYFRNSLGSSLIEDGPAFSESYMTRGNVQNGYGLFTIFSAVTDTIR